MAKLTIDIGAKIDKLKQGLNRASNSIKNFGRKASKMAQGPIAALGVGIGAMIAKSAKLAAQFEQIKVAFTTMTGSAEKAKALISELNEFSKNTPFSPDQVNKAAKTLLAFGFAAKDVKGTLKLLGDVSAGTGKDLSEMAVIFGQIKGAGRLMGGDLLQLINAGFNPLQVISDKTGKSMKQLKEEMSKGLITFNQVEGAFKDATSEGGIFFNMMEKQSKTLDGKLSTLKGNINDLFLQFGNLLLPELTIVVEGMDEAIRDLAELAEARRGLDEGGFAAGESFTLPAPTADEVKKAREEGISNEGELYGLLGGNIMSGELARQVVETDTSATTEDDVAKERKRLKDAAEAAKPKDFAPFMDDDWLFDLNSDMGDVMLAGDQAMDAALAKGDKLKEEAERAKLLGVEKADVAGMQERASALQKSVGAAFQPGGVIRSRLANIGGDRSINVDRQIPKQQLDELVKLNKGIALQTERIDKLDFDMRFP